MPSTRPVDQPAVSDPVQGSSESRETGASPAGGTSTSPGPVASPRETGGATPPRPSSRQAVPAKPTTFGAFELKDAGTGGDALVTYWTAARNKFFIIGYQPGGSVDSQTKDLKDVRVFGRTTCGTGAFGGYECFAEVHGGVGRTTMGPDVTLEELAETSRTFYEAWK